MSSRKTVLITGCSEGGLGHAMAVAFNRVGWRVLATARNTAKMASLEALGIELLKLDVQSDESIKACIKDVSKLTDNKLDMLVNNAGGGYSMPIADLDMGSTRSIFELNVFSVIRTIQLFLPLLIANRSGATIVNHTSVAGITPGPFQAAYNASKAAMGNFTESMRLEMEPFNINVIDLKTGATKSNFFSSIGVNDHGTKLPEGSIYSSAKEAVEFVMSGAPFMNDAQPQDVWAKGVVRDLTKSSPPSVIYRGSSATVAWTGYFLPAGVIDFILRRIFKINEISEKIGSQRRA